MVCRLVMVSNIQLKQQISKREQFICSYVWNWHSRKMEIEPTRECRYANCEVNILLDFV